MIAAPMSRTTPVQAGTSSPEPTLRLAGFPEDSREFSSDVAVQDQVPEHVRAEARKLIAEAEALLESLQQDRQKIRNRLERLGRVDPMQQVRGVSSMDVAIDDAKELIEATISLES